MLSHPPIRPLPRVSSRPPTAGPARYSDPLRGNDGNPGTLEAPWRSVGTGVERTPPGGTLYLRGGTYYEQVYIARAAREDAPITLRSHPGELAVIDGGLREFFETPERAWAPAEQMAPDCYRSVNAYPNARYLLGSLGDSMVGMLAYYHREDIAERERTLLEYEPGKRFPSPVYLGPGVWYDEETGYLYARLSHTHYNFNHPGMADYAGERDARRMPMVIAPYRSVPLFLDGARHIVLQDLVIRGAGENSVVLHGCENVTFDNVTIYAGTYGLRSRSSGPVKFLHSAIHGSIPPWSPHSVGSLRISAGQTTPTTSLARELARLNTHVTLAIEGRTEEQVDYGWPTNRNWEIAWSDFTDSHDGNHLGGWGIRFHHNRLERIFDDALYLTPLTPQAMDDVHVHSNHFVQCGMAFGFGGMSEPGGPVYIYRNVVDMRWATPLSHYRLLHLPPLVRHGGRVRFGGLYIYQNTFLSTLNPRVSHASTQDLDRSYAQATLALTESAAPRRVFNNIFVHLEGMVPPRAETLPHLDEDVQLDGNAHWDVRNPQRAAAALEAYRASEFFAATRARYPAGWEANARAGDPKFSAFSPDPAALNDYRIGADGAAAGTGVALPKEWPDALPRSAGRPDAGALPVGAPPLAAGRGLQETAHD